MDELPAFAKRIVQVRQANIITTPDSPRQSTDGVISKSTGDILAERAAAITQMRNERKPHAINSKRQEEMKKFMADQDPVEESAFDAGNRIQQSMYNYQDRYFGNNKPKVEMPDDYFTKSLLSHNEMTRTRVQDDINELNAINTDLHRKQMEILTGVKPPDLTTVYNNTTVKPVVFNTYRIDIEPNGGTINSHSPVFNSTCNEPEHIKKFTEFFEPLSPISSDVSDAKDLDSLVDLSVTKHTITNPVSKLVQTNITINPDIKIQKETMDDIKHKCTAM